MSISLLTFQWIILIGLLVITILIMAVRHRIRIIFIIPLVIAALFALGTIIFPLYEEGPDFASFYQTQESSVFFTTSQTGAGKIMIKNSMNIYELDGRTTTSQQLPTNLETTVSFIASSMTGDFACVLLLPEGTSIEISPQSQISFLAQYPKIFIEAQEGEAIYIPSDNYSQRQLFLTGITQQNKEKNKYQAMFEQTKQQAISTQTEGIFLQNPYLKAINQRILQTLARLWPARFEDNIANFEAFAPYIATEEIRDIDTTVDENIQTDVINQAKKGWEETKLYERRHDLFG